MTMLAALSTTHWLLIILILVIVLGLGARRL
jgi:Sec-independent protein translocase protein TatA